MYVGTRKKLCSNLYVKHSDRTPMYKNKFMNPTYDSYVGCDTYMTNINKYARILHFTRMYLGYVYYK